MVEMERKNLLILGSIFILIALFIILIIPEINKDLILANNKTEIGRNNIENEVSESEQIPKGGPLSKEVWCDAWVREIKGLLEEANYCEREDDCRIYNEGICPSGCYYLYNKDYDFLKALERIKEYRESCELCDYDCPSVDIEMIRCVDRKCVL
jgi:hypothetical protein